MTLRDKMVRWLLRGRLLILLSAISCGTEDTIIRPLPPSARELTAAGWVEYEKGNLSGASESFTKAIGIDPSHAEAYVGDGWSRLGLAVDSLSLAFSLGRFDEAIKRSPAAAEAHAGRAAVLLALGSDSLTGVIDAAREARRLAPDFVFAHRPSFDHIDLWLLEAFARAARGEFTTALQLAEQIRSSDIREDEPATWWVDGIRYRTFMDAVLGFLHLLSKTEAG